MYKFNGECKPGEKEEADFETWTKAGKAEDDFEYDRFDKQAAVKLGNNLAKRIIASNAQVRVKADEELTELGLSSLQLMGNAYRSNGGDVNHHDDKIQELERRRRLVKADLDALQKARPVDVEVIEG